MHLYLTIQKQDDVETRYEKRIVGEVQYPALYQQKLRADSNFVQYQFYIDVVDLIFQFREIMRILIRPSVNPERE